MKSFRVLGILGILTLAVAIPVRGYVTSKSLAAIGGVVQQKWRSGSFPLVWRMNPTKGANVTGAREQADVLRQSFQAWQSLTTATISFSEGAPTDAGVKPGFDQINLVTTNLSASDYSSSALGLTLVFAFDVGGPAFVDEFSRPVEFPGQIVEADVMFNPGVLFTTETGVVSNRYDLQSVATHEIGHFLGLDHTSLVSSTMFPTLGTGFNYAKTLSADDIAGVSTIYPSASFATKGKITGTVRTTANAAVYGAIVVAVNANGQPVASSITNPSGQYTIEGLDAGVYTVYAEPLDQPITVDNVSTLTRIYAGQVVNTNFTTRFR